MEDLKPSAPKVAKHVLEHGKEKVEEGARKVEQRVRGGSGNSKAEDS
jgi:hypothetical protein